jgi:carboxypeptidase C (cathepsin A)
MPDLALAMKRNPKMKVMLMGGYFDLGTLFFGATYEMKHLPMPQSLQANISYHWFHTGHMVYVNEDSLKELHQYTAAFIRENAGTK